MVSAQTPTLAKIKNSASETDARALLYIAICELCDFFNVGKNMNDTQVALTVDLILESFWHLKLEEIKFCFRRAMSAQQLYDRLDGNIILGWLRDYDAERTEEAMRQSDQEALQRQNAQTPAEGAISWETYVNRLWNLAYYADPEAVEKLSQMMDAAPSRMTLMTAEKKRDFKQFYNQ